MEAAIFDSAPNAVISAEVRVRCACCPPPRLLLPPRSLSLLLGFGRRPLLPLERAAKLLLLLKP